MNRVTAGIVAGVSVVLLGLLLLQGGYLSGQGAKEDAGKEKEPRKLHTSGSATIRIKPNRARLFLAVETVGATVKEARGENKKDVEKIIAGIQAQKIPDLKMKSTDVHMDVVYAKDEKQSKLPAILGYRVTYTFSVLVASEDTQKLSSMATQVLDTALENGANAIQQITFFKDDLTETKRQALTKATADAVTNAKALAAGDNRNVTDVISIDGNPEYLTASNTNYKQPAGPADVATSLVAGDVEVTCRVSITCTFGAAK